jgi:uncharacterized protein YhdP
METGWQTSEIMYGPQLCQERTTTAQGWRFNPVSLTCEECGQAQVVGRNTLSASPLVLSTWLGRPRPSALLTVKACSMQLLRVLRVLAAACELVLHFLRY